MTQIKAKIIADSINILNGVRAITWELEYPRFIHAEFMTHRMFSRNAASSRAIPVSKMIEQVENNPAMPVHWGKNKSGMQAEEELSASDILYCQDEWKLAAKYAAHKAERLHNAGLHKQATNRVLEPFQIIKVVMTSTERNNWYNLRYHSDAQPEIFELAKIMKHAEDCNKPNYLWCDEWHMPYIQWNRDNESGQQYFFTENEGKREYLTVDEALILSSSLCAQVSYRKSDDSLEKAMDIWNKLVQNQPIHASPTEHQLQVKREGFSECIGWTHVDRTGQYWSGNIRGWIQHRQLLENHWKEG